MNVEKHIPELLHEHDCVIVPGFGGFIANYASAQIHPVQHAFHPPFKSILFNVSLRQNDGLLANHISREENLSFLESLRAITRMTEEWNRILGENKTVNIPDVGMITRDAEGHLQFKQDHSVNFLSEAYGLASFVSPPVERRPVEKNAERKIRKFVAAPAGKKIIVPKVLKWAAVLAIPVGLATVFSLANKEKVRNLALNYSGLVYSVTSSYIPSDPARTIVVPEMKRTTVTGPSVIIPVHSAPSFIASTEDFPYAVIVGAFQVKGNADRLVGKLRGLGFDSRIVDRTAGGLHRVTLQNYPTRKEAVAQLRVTQADGFPGAWILRKTR